MSSEINISALPMVLCGPILRRVEPRSVSVFVALKAARFIDLTIHVDPSNPTSSIPSYNTTPRHSVSMYASSGEEIPKTVALGQYLHVAVVTLEIPTTSEPLEAGILYGYNLRFYTAAQEALDNTASAPSNDNIISLAQRDYGLLTSRVEHSDGSVRLPVGYAANRLPSFSLPPKDFGELNMIHGSCRKPHGEGDDMLAALDDLMVNTLSYNDPSRRPHLLLLTGDQIYADDVSPPLLRALHDASRTLLGWDEVFYGTGTVNGSFQDYLETIRETALNIVQEAEDTISLRLKNYLDALAEALETASTSIAAPDESIQTQIFKQMIQGLKVFRTTLFALRDTDDATSPTLSEAEKQAKVIESKELAQKIIAWIDDHRSIFGDLASPHSWGHIEVKADDQPYVASRISPPQREKELKEFAALTSDAMAAHLMFLGEFYMMYLFTWSDVLWRQYETSQNDNGEDVVMTGSIKLRSYDETVPNYSLLGALNKRNLEKIRVDTETFAKSLSKVRRVLANIPTLMIFDDHEVTDDWNLNEDWLRKVNDSVMGPSVLRNALSAYAIFQDWGNQPKDYKGNGKGKTILDALRVSIDGESVSAPAVVAPLNDEQTASGQILFDIFGIGPAVASAFGSDLAQTFDESVDMVKEVIDNVLIRNPVEDLFYLAPEPLKTWDWVYAPYPDEPFFKIICLDTRTRRGYPTKRWGLRYELPIKDLFIGDSEDNDDTEGNSKIAFDGRVAPVSLIYKDELDRQLRPLPQNHNEAPNESTNGDTAETIPSSRLSDQQLNIVISPAPVFGLPLLEDFVQRALVLSSGPEVADYEAWQGNPAGFEALLERFKGHDVVLLSGDVHYAYSNQIEFTSTHEAEPSFQLIQLCSSSMKNETRMTRVLGRSYYDSLNQDFLKVNFQRLREAVEDYTSNLGDALLDLTELPEWFSETAPLVPAKRSKGAEWWEFWNYEYNPESHVTHYLKLKDNLLFSFNLLLPNAVMAMAGSIGAYFLEPIRKYTWNQLSPPEEENDSYSIQFLKDHRKRSKRASDAEQYNPDNPKPSELYLSEMPEVVGYNNFGRLLFERKADDSMTFGSVTHQLFWHVHDWRLDNGNPTPFYFATTQHTKLSRWARFKILFANQALSQLGLWRPQGEPPVKEDSERGLELLDHYYKYMKPEWDSKGISIPSLSDPDELSGRAWSALFVSYCAKVAGAGDAFEYSPGHIFYMRAALRNRLETNANRPFWLYRLDEEEYELEVGDIVCAWRNNNYTYGDVEADLDIEPSARPERPSHCEVVVAANQNEAMTVGGNVSLPDNPNLGVTVGARKVSLVDGKIPVDNDRKIIAVIRVLTNLEAME